MLMDLKALSKGSDWSKLLIQLINSKTKVLGLISRFFSILNRVNPNLGFEVKTVEIRRKINEYTILKGTLEI